MRAKLLFIFGIVVAHGALAASWARYEAPPTRVTATCAPAPGLSMPDFTPRRVLLAVAVIPFENAGHPEPQ